MSAVTVLVAGAGDTSNAATYTSSSFTPTAGRGVAVWATVSGSLVSGGAAGTLSGSANGLTFHQVDVALNQGSSGQLFHFVANQVTPGSPVPMTVTLDVTGDSGTGAVLSVHEVSSLAGYGAAAIQQVKHREAQSSATTLAVTLDAPTNAANPVVVCMVNNQNPAGVTPPGSFTEGGDTGYATPTQGMEWAYRDSGHSSATVTWGSNSAGSWSATAVEYVSGTPPPAGATAKARSGGTWHTGTAKVRVAGAWRTGEVRVRVAGAWQPPPGFVAGDTIFGASAGAHAQTTATQLSPHMTRTFSTGVWAPFDADDIPICHSEKPGAATMAAGSGSAYDTAVTNLRNVFDGMKDIPGQRGTIHHEPIDDGITGATWSAAILNFKTDVIDVVNASRTNPIQTCGILNGSGMNGSTAPAYYPSSVRSADIEIGADYYQLSDLAAGISWMNSVGVTQWCIGELGYQVADPGHPDDEVLDFMNSALAQIAAAPMGPAAWCTWFNNLENCLVTRLSSATSIGATSFTVNNGFTPSGSSVVIGTGTGAETVTVGSYSGAVTFTCSAMTKAHAVGVPVFLRPESFELWKTTISDGA